MEDQGRQAVIACITLASFAIKALYSDALFALAPYRRQVNVSY